MKPVVSVIMPAFNREKLLPRSIDSVLGQTFKDWELIIIDDRSTDQTRAVVDKYRQADSRIKYLLSDRSQGPAGARNCGLQQARGEFIAFLDSDDEWQENYLFDCVKALGHEKVPICLSLFRRERKGKIEDQFLGIADKMTAALKPSEKDGVFYFLDKNAVKFMVLNWAFPYHLNASVFRKGVLDKIGGLNERIGFTDDFEYVFRALLYFDNFCLLNNFYYLYHGSADSAVNFAGFTGDNAETVGRLKRHMKNEIAMFKAMKQDIHSFGKIKRARACLRKIDAAIGDKYYSLGSLLKKTRRFEAARYFFISLFYRMSRLKFKALLLTIIQK